MARETTTVQCYPDDSIINEKIKEYEAFGWELINNQRCQEYRGQTSNTEYTGSWKTTVTDHYATFNKLTFSREKNTAWYSKIVDMEKEYNSLKNSKPSEPYYQKASGARFYLGAVIALLFIPFLSMGISYSAVFLTIIGIVLLVVGIAMIVTGIMKNKKYSQARASYRLRVSEWEKDAGVKMGKIKIEASKIVSQE